ncbi:MAG: hypothetical protein RQ748_00875 [Elusimicrobiales bacterium]|nr:hypothetical protein [Elusimicrobiales bacterium]
MRISAGWAGIAGWLAFAFACSAFFLPIVNPDIYWHLSAGRYMAAAGSLPRADFLSWTMAGADWVNFEWLPQLLYYAVHSAGGFPALVLLKSALLALTLLAVRASLVQNGRAAALPFALPLFTAAIVSACDLRPENFSVLFFAVTLLALEKLRLKGGGVSARSLAATALFFALWANSHAGYVYGLILVLFYAAGSFLDGRRGTPPAARPGVFLKLFAVGLAASLLNPYGWKVFAVMMDHQRHIADLSLYIMEWAPFDITSPYQWPYALTLAGSAVALVFFTARTGRPPAAHLASLLFFGYASLSHVRHTPFFMIAAVTFFAALPWERAVPPRGARVLKAAAAAALLGLAGWFYPRLVWSQYDGTARTLVLGSEGLAEFLRANQAPLSRLRMFNHWGWGGWLGWELAPEYKVYVDGRYLFHARLPELEELRSSPDAWRRLIERDGLELLLLRNDPPGIKVRQRMPDGTEQELTRPAYLFYLPKPEWAVVYWDDRAIVLVRRGSVPAAWLRGRELEHLRPGDTHNLRSAALAGALSPAALRRDLDRYLGSRAGTRENPAASRLIALTEEIETACAAAGTCAK